MSIPLKTRRSLSPLLMIFLLIAFLLLAMLIGGGVWIMKKVNLYQQAAATLPVERQLASKAGVLITPKEMQRNPPVPVSENAAPLYQNIFAQIAGKPSLMNLETSALKVTKPGATPDNWKSAEKMMLNCAKIMPQIERAASLPSCDFKRNWSLGPNLLLPEYTRARRLARILAIKAALESRNGHPEAALKDIKAIGRIGQHMGQDSVLIAMLVQIAIESLADQQMVSLLKRHGSRQEILVLSAKTEAAFGKLPDMRQSTRGEVLLAQVVFDGMRKGQSMPIANNLNWPPRFNTGNRAVMIDAYEARNLNYWRRFAAATANWNSQDPLATFETVQKVDEAEQREIKRVIATYELNAMLMPVFSQAWLKVIRLEALRRERRILRELFAYRNQTGHFPASLAEIKVSLPPDPFTRQPMHYKKTEKGFLLYSVGEDFKDDGGNIVSKSNSGEDEKPKDIGIAYP